MKIKIIIALLFSFLITPLLAENPKRYSTEVTDAFEPYTADEWIISPDEEPDNDSESYIDTDIYGVISCYDEDYIAFDILLSNAVTYEADVVYAMRIEFPKYSVYFTYDFFEDKLIYEKEQKGKIVDTYFLDDSNSSDSAGAISSDEGEDDMYFIIKKSDYIGGTKGKTYFIPCTFYAGHRDENGDVQIDDATITVNVYFVM